MNSNYVTSNIIPYIITTSMSTSTNNSPCLPIRNMNESQSIDNNNNNNNNSIIGNDSLDYYTEFNKTLSSDIAVEQIYSLLLNLRSSNLIFYGFTDIELKQLSYGLSVLKFDSNEEIIRKGKIL